MTCLLRIILLFFSVMIFYGCDFNTRTYNTLMLRLKEDVSTVDPAYIVDVDGANIAAYLYNGLVKLDTTMTIIPDIANNWEVSPDGLVYRFYLRDDVQFSSGESCIAEHIKRSFLRILDPSIGSPRSWIFEQVAGASDFINGRADTVSGFQVIDAHTFQIQLDQPFSPFLSLLTMPNAFIVIPSAEPETAYPIGTGPYVLENWIRGDKLILKKNLLYFDGKSHLTRIMLKIIPEDFTAITEFETGMLDIMDIPPAEFEYFTENAVWKDSVYSIELLNTYYLGFNCEQTPCSDAQFRRTVSASISTDNIIQYYFRNRVEKAVSPVPPPLLKPYNIMLSGKRQHNLEVVPDNSFAKTPLILSFNSNSEMQAIAELIQYDLANIGITVTLEALEWTAFKEKVSAGSADMFLLSWWADYPDIENFLYPVFHSANWGGAGNRVRYKNTEFDAMIDRARTAADYNERGELYGKALDIIMEDAPWCVLWHKKKYVVCQPWVKGFFLAPISGVDKGTMVFLEKK